MTVKLEIEHLVKWREQLEELKRKQVEVEKYEDAQKLQHQIDLLEEYINKE